MARPISWAAGVCVREMRKNGYSRRGTMTAAECGLELNQRNYSGPVREACAGEIVLRDIFQFDKSKGRFFIRNKKLKKNFQKWQCIIYAMQRESFFEWEIRQE